MTPDQARELLQSPESLASEAFNVLQTIARLDASGDGDGISQELVLRCLGREDEFNGTRPILHQLAREHGLFPYLDQNALELREQIAFEFHKPGRLAERGVVFHGPQARVFRALMDGESLILSAPTSFGKSLVIDALILNERFDNILVVVPTIALMDETRRRLNALGSGYKTITHLAQEPAERNVYVMTQERVVEVVETLDIDFFVIDEFYKLAPRRSDGDDDRARILNQVFYRLAGRGIPFYLLGPSVRAVTPELSRRFECRFLYEPYHTVVSELHYVDGGGDECERLVQLCGELEGPTIVYCRSPARAAQVAERLAANREQVPSDSLRRAVEWIGAEYHEEWHLAKALNSKIGVHHGRIPRSLAQFVVHAFEEGEIDILICTSTLIEGVNTQARNIVVLDNTVSTSRFDFFTFNNIRGRSGRMFQHFVGHVYLFHDPPPDELPFIDVPAVTQSEDASDGLLLQLDEEELDDVSARRTRPYREQELLSLETLRANSGLEPGIQLAIAQTLMEYEPERALLAAGWSGHPSWDELVATCELIWGNVGGSRLGSGSVRSARQLAFRINQLREHPPIRSLIDGLLEYRRESAGDANPDDAVQNVLDFLRLWAGFHFPRLLSSLDRIQREVLPRMGLEPGSLLSFANEVEHLFLGAHVVALEEFGLPLQIGQRLPFPDMDLSLDECLEMLRGWRFDDLELELFERELLEFVRSSLG